ALDRRFEWAELTYDLPRPRSSMQKQLSIQAIDIGDESRHAVARDRTLLSLCSEPLPQVAIAHEPGKPVRNRVRIAGLYDESRLAVHDDVANAADICRHDRHPRGLRFDH